MNLEEIISRRRKNRLSPSEEELRSLPDRLAYVYGRVSKPEQVHESEQSIKEIGLQVALAHKDGYKTELSQEEVDRRIQAILRSDPQALMYWEDREVIVDCRDLGISGQLSEAKRPGLAHLRQMLETGKIGCLYLTEGMSRLSRDENRIISHQLLKLLKEQRCRVRTPDGLWNPAIERDWEYLHDELEDAAEEKKVMGKRLRRRRNNKAREGRHVGTPVVAGYIVSIQGQRADGRYILDKWKPYPPHAEIVNLILKRLVELRSPIKVARSLAQDHISFPLFPAELAYMTTRSMLRCCHHTATGYLITPPLVSGLAQNAALIGAWSFSNQPVIPHNHEPIVSEDLFWQACEVATSLNKPKGKAVEYDPLPFSGLLWCSNHPVPVRISSHSCDGTYVCKHDYALGRGPICLDSSHQILDIPLLTVILEKLDFTSFADEIITRLEADYDATQVQVNFRQKQEADLEQRIKHLKGYLGSPDREKEETYWSLIREAQAQLEQLRSQPLPRAFQVPLNLHQVRNVLARLKTCWEDYSPILQNRLLQIFLERVEVISNTQTLEVTIIWKVGLRQKLIIERPPLYGLERVWSTEEKELLRALWPSATKFEIEAVLPERTWKGMGLMARRLGVKRLRVSPHPENWRPWTDDEDAKLKELYHNGEVLTYISTALGRSQYGVAYRIQTLHLERPRPHHRVIPHWRLEQDNLIGSEATCPPSHL